MSKLVLTSLTKQHLHHFLYGSLMDPFVLRRVLNLTERPRLRPASIVGYHVKMWGPCPALIVADGVTGTVVRGVVYEFKSSKMRDRLAYKTGNSREHRCLISVDGRRRTLEAVVVRSQALAENVLDIARVRHSMCDV